VADTSLVNHAPVRAQILFQDEYVHPRYGVPGLTIRKNPRNQFCVVSLYYFADPVKRSDSWEAAARAGMTRAGFEKEYLINYTALFGEKVFPQIYERGSEIIIPAREFLPSGARFYAGFDYGWRNPSAFVVFAVEPGQAEQPARTYAVWELYEPCRNVPEMASKIRSCPYYPWIQWIAADPSIWTPTQQQRHGNMTSVQQMFADEGVEKMLAGITNEGAWIARMRQHWEGIEEPTFLIVKDQCPNLLRELQMAVYSDPKNVSVNTVMDEGIADSNNHALDATKYFMNSMPEPGITARSTLKWPIMINRWKK
jgi:hypothetical protein